MKKRTIWTKLGDFLEGRGFYIVLALCIVAIGGSGYYLYRMISLSDQLANQSVSAQASVPSGAAQEKTDTEQAVEDAVVAEHGNRHTASIFSKDVDHMTRFVRVIETTIYVKNSATKAGVGIGGEGHCTMTIAGPTGEGITCAKSFCRRRRCMLAEGGLRII